MADLTPEEQAYLKAQAAEWGTYVATSAIHINGARAFNPGDPVPASHVERGVVSSDDVAKTNTKAAKAVTEES
jgi:hypothetical protein